MRLRLSVSDIAFVVVVGVLLATVLMGLGVLPLTLRNASQSFLTAAVSSMDNAIVRENALPGSTGWEIPNGKGAINQIQAYASAVSVLPGHTLTFYVSTQIEGTSYTISIYRLGWYGGLGGRLGLFQYGMVGHAQGYYDFDLRKKVDCNSCEVKYETGLVEANWRPSYTITVPSDWTTGVYLAKFTDANDMQTYVPFDVRDQSHSQYIVVTPDTTNEAYNPWGGYSFYTGMNGLVRGTKVSFDRPYIQVFGSAQTLSGEADAIHWLERQGYDLSYMSDVDLHEDPGQLLNHRVYLSLGHDEYWTKEMRDGVEHARDSGVGLAFLGGNDVFWQMRFEQSSTGVPDRTIVCYKVSTASGDFARDPLYGKDNTRVTAQWRDPVLARPENALMGIMSSGVNQQQQFPWQVSSQANSPLLDGTGLVPGKTYGCDIVGNEWDRVFNNGNTPAGLKILSMSPTIGQENNADFSNTAYYIASSGAMVFDAGSIYWAIALDSYRFQKDKACGSESPVVPGIQALLAHVIDALVTRHLPQVL